MRSAPRLSLASPPQNDPSAMVGLGSSTTEDQQYADIRLTAVDRQFVTDLLTQLEERLSVDGFMFLAGGAEQKAKCKWARESGRR
jgi:hypothetical protein